MRRLLFTVAALALSTGSALAQSTPVHTPLIGSIMTYAANFCPEGYLPANGQILAIASYPRLYSVIGSVYGGDGRTTFALPTVKPVITADNQPLLQCIAFEGAYPAHP